MINYEKTLEEGSEILLVLRCEQKEVLMQSCQVGLEQQLRQLSYSEGGTGNILSSRASRTTEIAWPDWAIQFSETY